MIRTLFISIFLLFLIFHSRAQDLSQDMTKLIASIEKDSDQSFQFDFDDEERFNMNFTPVTRKGINFHQMSDQSGVRAFALLARSLSKEGYQKAQGIIELEKVLFIKEGWAIRDPLKYHVSIFGSPSPTGIWGWRFEGHHLSVNLTIQNNKIISSTPTFFGSNPGIVKIEEQKGKEVLKKETELGLQLVNALGPQQLEICRIATKAPREIITGTDRKVTTLEPKGILYKDLNEEQQTMFLNLLDVYISNYEFGFASELRDKIEQAGIQNLSFAWAGGLQRGIGHYYRIQGPMLLIEYDNIQNNANHVHTVVRDLTNDYAEDFLKRHYEKEH